MVCSADAARGREPNADGSRRLDYRIATFVGTTAITFVLLVHRWAGWRLVLYGLGGAALPLAIFCVEVLAFALFQVEYAMALFMGVMMTLLAIMTHGWRSRSLILAMAVGGAVSAVVFGVQVLTYYGWDGFLTRSRTPTPGEVRPMARPGWAGTPTRPGTASSSSFRPSRSKRTTAAS